MVAPKKYRNRKERLAAKKKYYENQFEKSKGKGISQEIVAE